MYIILEYKTTQTKTKRPLFTFISTPICCNKLISIYAMRFVKLDQQALVSACSLETQLDNDYDCNNMTYEWRLCAVVIFSFFEKRKKSSASLVCLFRIFIAVRSYEQKKKANKH